MLGLGTSTMGTDDSLTPVNGLVKFDGNKLGIINYDKLVYMTNQTRAPTIDDSVDPVNGRIFKQGELWVHSDKVYILSNFDSNNKPVWVMITSANTVSDIVDGSITITKLQGNQITTAGLPNCLVKTDTNGNIKASGNIISTNSIIASNTVTGNVTASGNITATNLSATNTMTNQITATSGNTVNFNGFRINNGGTNMDLTVSAADDCNLWLNCSGVVYYRADSDNDLTGTKVGHVFKSSQQDIMYVGNTSIDCLRPIKTSKIISSNNITFGNPVVIENLPSGVVRSNNNTLTTGNVGLSDISQAARTSTGENSKLVEINADGESTIKKLKTDNIMLNSSNITISNVTIQDKNVKLQSISPVDSSQEMVVNGHLRISGTNELRMGLDTDASRIVLWDGRYHANVDLRLPNPNDSTYAQSIGHVRLQPTTHINYQNTKWAGAERWVMGLNTISPSHGLYITHGALANSKSDKYVIDAAIEGNVLYVDNINPLKLGSNITLGNVAITNINEVNASTALNVNCGNINLNGTVHLNMADGVLAVSNKKIVSTDPGQATLPFGVIMAYAGGVSIPTGWVECNGQTVQDRSGTNFMVPDSRGLFIRGKTGAEQLTQLGGSGNITLTTDQMPRHTHTMASSGTHYHYIDLYSNGVVNSSTRLVSGSDYDGNNYGSVGTRVDGSHNHPIDQTGNGAPIDITPRHMALIYIFKL